MEIRRLARCRTLAFARTLSAGRPQLHLLPLAADYQPRASQAPRCSSTVSKGSGLEAADGRGDRLRRRRAVDRRDVVASRGIGIREAPTFAFRWGGCRPTNYFPARESSRVRALDLGSGHMANRNCAPGKDWTGGETGCVDARRISTTILSDESRIVFVSDVRSHEIGLHHDGSIL